MLVDDEDLEDFCDTNDNIDTIKLLKSKVNGLGGINNGFLNGGEDNYDENRTNENIKFRHNENDDTVFTTVSTDNLVSTSNNSLLIIDQYGGESNATQANYSKNTTRPSKIIIVETYRLDVF